MAEKNTTIAFFGRILETINPIRFFKGSNTPFKFGSKGIRNSQMDINSYIGSDPMAIWRTQGSKKISSEKAMAHNTDLVYASVKAIAREIASVQFRLFLIQNDGNHEEQFDHDILDLLDGVNEMQTGPELKYIVAAHLELVGNSYLLLLNEQGKPVKSATEKPSQMFPLDPSKIKIDLEKSDWPYRVKGYKFEIDNRKWYYQAYQIVHLKYPDPAYPYEGIGTPQSIPGWIDNDSYATEWNRQFFLNGARMDGLFETEYTTEVELMALKLSWESNHGGVQNSHKVGFLPKGVKYISPNSTAKDMDFAKMLEVMRDRILAAFGVSKTILGTAESDTNRATAETADYVFAKRTIKSKMEFICSYLNEFLVPRFGDNIYISFQDPTPEDKNFRMEEMAKSVGSQPILSVNEAREHYLGRGPVKGGDMVKVGNAMSDLGSAQEEGSPAGSPETPVQDTSKFIAFNKKNGKRIIKTRSAKNFQLRQKLSKAFADTVAEELKKAEAAKKKGWAEMTKEEYYYIWKDFNSRMDKYEKKVEKVIQEINQGQRKEVLRNITQIFALLSKNYKYKAGLPDLFNLEHWVGITIDLMTPLAKEIGKKEGEIAATGVGQQGINILEDENYIKALDKSIELLSRSYNETTMAQLKDKLNEAISSGEGLQHATDLVSGIYDFADVSRAQAVATTETFRIGNDALKEGLKQTELVSTVVWHAFDDDLTCQFCQTLDGKVVEIDDNFLDNGDSVKGVDGDIFKVDYSDVGAPPLHTSCRCILKPGEITI